MNAADDALEPSATPTSAAPSGRAATVPDAVQRIVDALDDRRAKDITVLNLTGVSASLDWFIVATGESSLQLKAMQDSVKETLKDAGDLPRGIEGPSNRWVLMDYGLVVVHLMSPEAREFYDIDNLDRYYKQCVIGGEAAFIAPVYDLKHFAATIRKKLVMEIASLDVAPPDTAPIEFAEVDRDSGLLQRVQLKIPEEEIDCMIGERVWGSRGWGGGGFEDFRSFPPPR